MSSSSMKVVFVLAVCGLLVCSAFARTHNAVGVLTKNLDDDGPEQGSYLTNAIVRYLQEQGLYVVPLIYDMDNETIANLLPKLSGVLFTGGGGTPTPGTKYYETGKQVFDFVISEGEQGRPFPLFGVCLGFEMISVITANDHGVLGEFDATAIPLPLEFTEEAADSAMFRDAPAALLHSLKTRNLTWNNHEYGVSPTTYATNSKLKKMFKVLTTNKDRKGTPFVSTIEARDSARFPIFATQWHPECASWLCFRDVEEMNSVDGLEASLWIMRPFAEAAKKSNRGFPSDKDLFKARIENYPYTYDPSDGTTMFYFPQWTKP